MNTLLQCNDIHLDWTTLTIIWLISYFCFSSSFFSIDLITFHYVDFCLPFASMKRSPLRIFRSKNSMNDSLLIENLTMQTVKQGKFFSSNFPKKLFTFEVYLWSSDVTVWWSSRFSDTNTPFVGKCRVLVKRMYSNFPTNSNHFPSYGWNANLHRSIEVCDSIFRENCNGYCWFWIRLIGETDVIAFSWWWNA